MFNKLCKYILSGLDYSSFNPIHRTNVPLQYVLRRRRHWRAEIITIGSRTYQKSFLSALSIWADQVLTFHDSMLLKYEMKLLTELRGATSKVMNSKVLLNITGFCFRFLFLSFTIRPNLQWVYRVNRFIMGSTFYLGMYLLRNNHRLNAIVFCTIILLLLIHFFTSLMFVLRTQN